MTWQDTGVVLIVAAAVAFLVRRVFPGRGAREGTETFVPVASIKHRREHDKGCH
jgi:hypothetical protein